MKEKIDRLDKLFQETGNAHHHEWPGIHEDWAIWYAKYLFDRVPDILGQTLILSEIIYAVMRLSKEQPVAAPDVPWTRYYAEWFLNEYGGGEGQG